MDLFNGTLKNNIRRNINNCDNDNGVILDFEWNDKDNHATAAVIYDSKNVQINVKERRAWLHIFKKEMEKWKNNNNCQHLKITNNDSHKENHDCNIR